MDRILLETETRWSRAVTAEPAADAALVDLAGMNDDALLQMFYVADDKDQTPKVLRVRQAELVQVNFARLLLESGADPEAENDEKITALSLAERNHREDLAALLRSKDGK